MAINMSTFKSIVFVLCLLKYSLGINAQLLGMTIDDKCLVQFNKTNYELTAHLDIPEGEGVQHYLAKLIFGEENCDVKTAYDSFLKNWHKRDLHSSRETGGEITINIKKEYEQDGSFACYHVNASVSGTIKLSGLPQTPEAQKMKAQYFLLSNGIDHGFIIDTQKHEIIGIDQIFIPSAAQSLKGIFGDDINIYAEDRCLQLSSKKNDGRFIFSETTKKHFTDYFRYLVGWDELKNCDSPRFLRGEEGLKKYLADNKFLIASDNEEADTIIVSLIISEDGTPLQPTIEISSKYLSEKKILDLCGKMPKWVPAYQDGKPITKEAFFTLRYPRVFGAVEKMPTFPGGKDALMRFLARNIRYPEDAEDSGIQGRVGCSFIVECDGSITNIRITKSVDPSLDKEAIRVLRSMPKWNPGTVKGEPVRVTYHLPIMFSLSMAPNGGRRNF